MKIIQEREEKKRKIEEEKIRIEEEKRKEIEQKRMKELEASVDWGTPIIMSNEAKNIIEALEMRFPLHVITSSFEEAFEDTEILDYNSRSYIYMNCLNFKGREKSNLMPSTELVYSFKRKNFAKPGSLKEIFAELHQPTVFVFKVGDRIFGGYADDHWNFNGKKGNDNCFLFSVDKDLILSRNKLEKNPIYMWKEVDGMGWGAADLILNEDVIFINYFFFLREAGFL